MKMNDEASERFTLAQAAQALGVSVPTARRLIFSKKLHGFKVMKGDKERWEVLKSEVFSLKHSGFDSQAENASKPQEQTFFHKENRSQNASPVNASGSVPVQAHLAALELVSRLHGQLEEERRQREQAERSKMAMEWQMQQYRSALAEQAESLAEAQAMRRVAEARLNAEDEAPVLRPPVVPLEHLKLGKSDRRSWGQRLQGWLGLRKAEG